jgi:hypothetical protein
MFMLIQFDSCKHLDYFQKRHTVMLSGVLYGYEALSLTSTEGHITMKKSTKENV